VAFSRVVMEASWAKEFESGSNSSVERVDRSLPEPPTMRTRPSGSTVAVWSLRGSSSGSMAEKLTVWARRSRPRQLGVRPFRVR